MNRAAVLANSPAVYDARRAGAGMELDPLPVTPFRLTTTWTIVEWCWAQQPGQPRALLDLAAGVGIVGASAHGHGACAYHATEQSPRQCEEIQGRVPGASVALWRCAMDGPSLLDALREAEATFLPAYPVVLLSHGVEHYEDAYAVCDQAWSLVAPGGFLLLVSARNDAHRSHFRKYDWDDLLALGAHYAGLLQPMLVWEGDYWTDLYLAIPKPGEREPG